MPENIVVTLKTEQPGGFWPFVRGTFAWIGFGAVVVGVVISHSPDPQERAAQIIEVVGKNWRAFEAAYHAAADPYGKPPFDPIPKAAAGPVGNPYDAIPLLPGKPSEKRN